MLDSVATICAALNRVSRTEFKLHETKSYKTRYGSNHFSGLFSDFTQGIYIFYKNLHVYILS